MCWLVCPARKTAQEEGVMAKQEKKLRTRRPLGRRAAGAGRRPEDTAVRAPQQVAATQTEGTGPTSFDESPITEAGLRYA